MKLLSYMIICFVFCSCNYNSLKYSKDEEFFKVQKIKTDASATWYEIYAKKSDSLILIYSVVTSDTLSNYELIKKGKYYKFTFGYPDNVIDSNGTVPLTGVANPLHIKGERLQYYLHSWTGFRFDRRDYYTKNLHGLYYIPEF